MNKKELEKEMLFYLDECIDSLNESMSYLNKVSDLADSHEGEFTDYKTRQAFITKMEIIESLLFKK